MGIIGIIGAMASEVELLVQQMEEGSVLRHAGLEFHYGLLAGKPAVVGPLRHRARSAPPCAPRP